MSSDLADARTREWGIRYFGVFHLETEPATGPSLALDVAVLEKMIKRLWIAGSGVATIVLPSKMFAIFHLDPV